MSEDRLDIKSLQEIAQKNLEVVQKILGVEPNNNSDENELESNVGNFSINSNKKLTDSETTEQKRYLIEQKRYLIEQKRYLIEQKRYLITQSAET